MIMSASVHTIVLNVQKCNILAVFFCPVWLHLPRMDGAGGQSHIIQVLCAPTESVGIFVILPGKWRHLESAKKTLSRDLPANTELREWVCDVTEGHHPFIQLRRIKSLLMDISLVKAGKCFFRLNRSFQSLLRNLAAVSETESLPTNSCFQVVKHTRLGGCEIFLYPFILPLYISLSLSSSHDEIIHR